MALFKILRGNSSSLFNADGSISNDPKWTDGYAYYCKDTHDFYIDHLDSSGKQVRSKLNSKEAEHALLADRATKADKADKLTTARKITAEGAVVSTGANFDGSAEVKIPISSVKEAYLTWGGKSLKGEVGPLGASLSEEHSANRLAFLPPEYIVFEHSDDGGATWYDSGEENTSHKTRFVTLSTSIAVARRAPVSTSQMMRCTITAQDGTLNYSKLYTRARKLLIDVNSAHSLQVKIEKKNGTASGAWIEEGIYDISGWTAWNDIPLSGFYFGGQKAQTSNFWQIRLTFAITGLNNSWLDSRPSIQSIRLFGDTMWATPSTLAKTGHLYSYDENQNATFPASIIQNSSAHEIYSKGSLKVDGSSTFAGSITANGNVTLGNASGDTINIKGTASFATPTTFNSTITGKNSVSFEKDLSIGSGIQIGDSDANDGWFDLWGSGLVSGDFSAGTISTGELNANDTNINGVLEASGATTLGNTLYVTGNTTLGEALEVNGDVTTKGKVTLGNEATDTVTINGNLTNAGTATFNKTVSFKEGVALDKNLTVKGSTTLGDNIEEDNVIVNSGLTVNGIAEFDTNVISRGSTATYGLVEVLGSNTISLQDYGVEIESVPQITDVALVSTGAIAIKSNQGVAIHALGDYNGFGDIYLGGIETGTTIHLNDNGEITHYGNLFTDGDNYTSGNISIDGTLTTKNNATLQKDLTVDGSTTLGGTLLAYSLINAIGDAEINVEDYGFDPEVVGRETLEHVGLAIPNIAAIGELHVGNTINAVGGIGTYGEIVAWGGLLTSGNISVDHPDSGSPMVRIYSDSGNIDAGSITAAGLEVQGDTTLNSTLSAKDNATFDKNLAVNGDTNLEATTIGGLATLNNGLTVSVGDYLSVFEVNGTSVESNIAINANRNLTVKGNTILGDDASVDTTTVNGATTINGALTVTGNTTLGTAAREDTITLNGKLEANAATTFNAALTAKAAANFDGQVKTTNYVIINDSYAQGPGTDASVHNQEALTVYGLTDTDNLKVWEGATIEKDVDIGGHLTVGQSITLLGNGVDYEVDMSDIMGIDGSEDVITTRQASIIANNDIYTDGAIVGQEIITFVGVASPSIVSTGEIALLSFDDDGNAQPLFSVNQTGNVIASKFTGNLTGNADTATSAAAITWEYFA